MAEIGEVHFVLRVNEAGYLLQMEGESAQARFARLQDAIKHAQARRNGRPAKLLVMSREGKPMLELEL